MSPPRVTLRGAKGLAGPGHVQHTTALILEAPTSHRQILHSVQNDMKGRSE